MKTGKFLCIISILAVTMLSQPVQAQTDSSQIQVTLKAKHHAFIIALMPSKSQVDEIRYITQVATALTVAADSAKTVDTTQQITVVVSTDLVKRLYLVIGSQQERLSTDINAEIKAALVPQLYTRPKLLASILDIAAGNTAQTNELVQTGVTYLKALKL
jgi:hypothetical protein